MSGIKTSSLLDFDRLQELAHKDPETFEKVRQAAIEATILRASKRQQPRLRCLQWRIEQIRRRSPNPLSACISLSDLMWDSLLGDRGLLDTIASYPNKLTATHNPPTLLRFPGKIDR